MIYSDEKYLNDRKFDFWPASQASKVEFSIGVRWKNKTVPTIFYVRLW